MGIPYLAYGSFAHDPGECSITIARSALAENGISYGYTERWAIQGRVQADTPGAVTAAILAREAAYKIPNQNLILYLGDGSASAHQINVAYTMGGVRTSNFVAYPVGRGAEYSTFRNFSVSVETDYLDPAVDLIAWTESITFAGGGPRTIWLEPLNGPPQQQLANEQTTFKATQTGEATGLFSYPFPPQPIWPFAEHVDQRRLSQTLPKRTGRGTAAFYSGYKISWAYQFESDSQLTGGAPTPWYD